MIFIFILIVLKKYLLLYLISRVDSQHGYSVTMFLWLYDQWTQVCCFEFSKLSFVNILERINKWDIFG